MKKLHFIENDYKCPASDDDISSAKNKLIAFSDIDEKRFNDMEIHYQFHLLKKDDIYNIIFNNKNILITHSVYISGSDSQLINLLIAAGRNDIKNITYLDTSGCIIDFIKKAIRDNTRIKNLYHFIRGVNTNNIITFHHNYDEPKRIKIYIESSEDNDIVLEDFDKTILL